MYTALVLKTLKYFSGDFLETAESAKSAVNEMNQLNELLITEPAVPTEPAANN